MKNKKIIGLIGGMGPFASAEFCKQLLVKSSQNFGAKNSDEFPEIILDSIPIPDFISNTKTLPIAKRMLISRVKKLDNFGCTDISMVCNTGHILFPVLSKVSNSNMISLIDAVRDAVLVKKLKRVGLLASKTTIKSGLFKKAFAPTETSVINPDNQTLDICERIIRGVIANNISKSAVRSLVKRTRLFMKKKRLDGIILGCTELPLAFPKNELPNVIDCLDVLSDKLLGIFFQKSI
jgi:aspartate racemase